MKYEEQNHMSRRVTIEIFVWIAALFALTGGIGFLVPRILGLGNCGDYWGGRVLWILFFTLVLGISAGLAAVAGERRIGGWLLRAAVVLCVSGFINTRLDQDPLAAWLNWEAPHLKIDSEWGCDIENHEQIRYSEKHRVFYGCGPCLPIPPEVRDEWAGWETF